MERELEKEHIKRTYVKDAFREHYISLLGSEEAYEQFIDRALEFPRRCIRVNTLKRSVEEITRRLRRKGWQLEEVPWCAEGFFIERDDRRDVGNLEEHALGYIYVQEASSMIPAGVLGARAGDLVLDMAAAPGSKSSQIAAGMENQGVLVANELDYTRIAALKANLERLGVVNAIITNTDGRRIRLDGFNRVLVDAPCSGTGTISKSLKTLEMWNLKSLARLHRLQLGLLEHAYALLREGGVVVYSTCSLEVEENERVLDVFFSRHPEARCEELTISPDQSVPLDRYGDVVFDGRVQNAVRLWPHLTGTDGFFVARICKP